MKRKVLLAIILFSILNVGLLNAQNKEKNNQAILDEQWKYLQEEIKNYREFIQHEMDQHQAYLESYYEKTVWIFGIALGSLIGFVTFLMLKTRSEVKKILKDMFYQQTSRYY